MRRAVKKRSNEGRTDERLSDETTERSSEPNQSRGRLGETEILRRGKNGEGVSRERRRGEGEIALTMSSMLPNLMNGEEVSHRNFKRENV